MKTKSLRTVCYGVVLSLGCVSSALAGTIHWTDACSIFWYDCCELGDTTNVNNWDIPGVAQPDCPVYPGPGNHVDLGDGAFVRLDQTNAQGPVTIASLNSDGSTFEHHTPGLTVINNVTLCGPFNMISDVLTVGPVMTVDNVWRWFGGVVAGPGITTASVAIDFYGLGNCTISERRVISTGIATWTGTGNIVFFSGGVFENQNIFEIRNNELFDAGGGGGTFRNLGTTTKLESDGLTFFDLDMTIENPGTFNINTGQVEIQGGGISTGIFHLNPGTTLRFNTISPFVFDGGADFTGGGLLRLSGAPIVLTAGTNIDIENVEMVGGGFDNSGNLEIDNLTWPIFGGTFLGPGTTTVRVFNDMAGFISRTISEQTFNTGPLTVWSDGAIRIKEEGHIINGGLFTAQDDANLIDFTNPDDGTFTNPLGSTMNFASVAMTFDGGTNGGTVNNDGTMNFRGTSCRIQDGVAVNNTGLFHVVSGEVRLTNQTVYTQTAGTTRVDVGALFWSTNVTAFLGGTIEGNGTVKASNTLVNEGATVRPGASAGELTIDGDYAQESGGTLQIEIGGLLPGDQHDVLHVTDTAVLGGTLELILVDGFVPEVGEFFVIMTAGAMSGTFDEVIGPGEFEVNYGADHVTLTVRSILKNRYVTFTPVEPGPVAYQLDMVASFFHATAVVSGWVGVPDAEGISSLEADPVTRVWGETIVHVTGCDIAAVAQFELSASLDGGGSYLPPLVLETIVRPAPNFWGDTVGFFTGEKWTPPQGTTNIDDAFAAIKSFQMADGSAEVPRSDVVPQEPNRVVNINDVLFELLAFQGATYPFGCPDDPCQDTDVTPCP